MIGGTRLLSPDKTGDWIDKALDMYLDDQLEDKSVEWAARNLGGIVSGGTFSKCMRQAWYKWFDERADERRIQFDDFSKRVMFLGHRSEDHVFNAIKLAQKKGDMTGIIHTEQLSHPVFLKCEVDGMEFGATTDGVVEDVLQWKGKTLNVHYPIELKQTDRPASSWWKRSENKQPIRVYDGKATHKRQLLHWMNLAINYNDMIVPYGLLKYYRRIDYDTLTWVYYMKEYESLVLDAFSHVHPQLYTFIEADNLIQKKEEDRAVYVQNINTKTLPPQGTGLTSYDCNSCPYKAPCFALDGDPRKRNKPIKL